jgi:hypothetical protein
MGKTGKEKKGTLRAFASRANDILIFFPGSSYSFTYVTLFLRLILDMPMEVLFKSTIQTGNRF